MRLRRQRCLLAHRPFEGDGVSLYATVGETVSYRALALVGRRHLRSPAETFPLGAASVLKTTRRTSAAAPDEEFDYTLPAEFASQRVTFDIRRYKDDVENEAAGGVTVEFDSDLSIVRSIDGVATLLSQEQRDGGIVRLKFAWQPARTGVQPTSFRAMRTAGPTSPADAVKSFGGGFSRVVVEIDTPALSDVSAYTYTIRAVNGGTTADVLTGITVSADATGPDAPVSGSAVAW